MGEFFSKEQMLSIGATFLALWIVFIAIANASFYVEPNSVSTYPLTKLDVGPVTSTKNGNLSIVSTLVGTTTITPSQIIFVPQGAAPGTISVQTINGINGLVPAVQSGQSIPLGFMWENSSDILATNYSVSVETSTSFGTLTITNGTVPSTVINVSNAGSSSTIAVGAYYDNSSGSWKTLYPNDTSKQPMAITFDPNSGLWFRSGATQSGSDIYWRASMHIDTAGNVTFSDRSPDLLNYLYWQLVSIGSNASGAAMNVMAYCADFPQDCDSGSGPIRNPEVQIRPGQAGTSDPCNYNNTIYYGDVVGFGIVGSGYAVYQCERGVNSSYNNAATLYVGNLFVENQSFSDSTLMPATTTVANPDVNDWWFECPDGYYASGLASRKVGNNNTDYIRCSKL